ncbi:MAG TPA: outer membrane beta-barrel domain-containing protein [Anaeromyxobacter sp.]|nr:outer membrane beta-barrel domain-containing protein [Anaeromyxobacter sp.]
MSLRPLAGAALTALALAATPAPARGQSKGDAFAGRIPPVSSYLYRKAGRFEVTLSGNLSLNDAFVSKYFGGVKVGYHLTEFFSVSGQVQAGTTSRTGSAQVCRSNQGCSPASPDQLWQVPGHLDLVAGVEAAWSPVYGKLNIASEKVVHFDLSLLGGVDWISYQEVVSSAQAADLVAAGQTPGNKGTIGGHVGLGVRLFFTEAIAARLELKDYIYAVAVPNWQEGGGARKDVQNQLFAELGVSVFFPFQNRSAP